MSKTKYALPEWRMHEAPMRPIGTINIERVEQGADSTAARMVSRGTLDALVDVELIILLGSHGARVDEHLESDVPTFTNGH